MVPRVQVVVTMMKVVVAVQVVIQEIVEDGTKMPVVTKVVIVAVAVQVVSQETVEAVIPRIQTW